MITGNKLNQIVYQYWANRFGCDQEYFHHLGTLVIREDELIETGRIYIYHIDQMSVVRISPVLAEQILLPVGYNPESGSLSMNQLQQVISEGFQTESGETFLISYLYPEKFRPVTVDDDFTVRQLFPENDNGILLDFYDQCTAEDLDDAEIFVDEPDPIIFGLFTGEQMVAYASHRYWDEVIADIGVLVHRDYRNRGLGKTAVSALCQWCIENDVLPMYRVFRGNISSWKIQEALGFTKMVTLEILQVKK